MASSGTSVSNTDTTAVAVADTLLILMFSVGLYLQIKIIITSKQEKHMTWQIDICNSIVMIIHYIFSIAGETTTYIIPSLSDHTGSWICSFGMFIRVYGLVFISGHSLVISIFKYFFIVRHQMITNFRKDRAERIFLLINLIYPSMFAVLMVVRPQFVKPLEAVNSCLGMTEHDGTREYGSVIHTLETVLFCGLDDDVHHSSFDYFLYIASQVGCFLQTVCIWIVGLNLLEIFFYKKIFRYMKR